MERSLGDHVVLVSRAAGATRLIASPDGGSLFAEIAGAWQAESFRNDDLPPPVLRRIDVGGDRVLATAMGWALTAPGAGDLYLAPGDAELTYRVRRLGGAALDEPLEPPAGVWAVKATLPDGAAGQGVAILWRPVAGTWAEVATRREELWLAAIAADTGKVTAQRTLTLAGRSAPRGMLTVGAGVAADPVDGTIYLASIDRGAGVVVDALDPRTLATRWTRVLAVPPDGLAAATTSASAVIGVTGDGAAIVVVVGDNQAGGVRPDLGYVLDRGGAVVKTLPASALQPYWDIAALGPAGPGQVIGHSVLESRRATRRFIGLFALRPGDGEVSLRFDPGALPRTRDLRALASTFDAAGKRALVAPESFEDCRNLGIDVGISTGTGTGLDREEIRDAITLPRDWYADGRPRYDAWRAQFR